MFADLRNKVAVVGSGLVLAALVPIQAFAEADAALGTAVTGQAADFKDTISANVPAILGIVTLVAAVTLFIRFFRRH